MLLTNTYNKSLEITYTLSLTKSKPLQAQYQISEFTEGSTHAILSFAPGLSIIICFSLRLTGKIGPTRYTSRSPLDIGTFAIAAVT
jgi:hypothetical protein